jgi:thiol-disulfide isomerase/thioredoxin
VAPVRGGLPDMTFACLEPGKGPARVRLAGLRGRPLVLNLWATWCTFCRDELPVMAQGARAAHGRVAFLGLDAEDSIAGAQGLAAAERLPYNSVVDPDGVTKPALYWATGLPVTVFVAADGRQAGHHIGPIADERQLAGLVKQYLGVDIG